MGKTHSGRVDRRQFIKATAATGASVAMAPLFAPYVKAADNTLKLGYVSPQTGPLAAFAEADEFTLGQFREAMKNGLDINGTNYAVEVVVKDSQSNPNRAAEVAKELIVDDEIDLMLVASTPETTNPVSTQCEIEEVPCVSTMAPWQPWFIGRQGNPTDPSSWQPFKHTFHYFWGLEDVIAVFTNMWKQLDTNKVVGGLFPNDGDGNAWGDPNVGFPPSLSKDDFKLIDAGRYQNLTDDFSAQITAFQSGDAEIVTGVVLPPDFTTFWNQANQKGFKPKAVSVGKCILFSVALEALGKTGNNLSSEVWWSPTHPFKSSLNGQTSAELAEGFTKATGRQWTQPIGFIHSLFEFAVDVLKRAADPTDAAAIVESMAKADLQTIVGPIKFGQDNVPPFARANLSKTPLVGGQWKLKEDGKYEIIVVDNQTAPEVPVAGKMAAIF
jgi:branched-chain amino acid transport system substrate-binding protein